MGGGESLSKTLSVCLHIPEGSLDMGRSDGIRERMVPSGDKMGRVNS